MKTLGGGWKHSSTTSNEMKVTNSTELSTTREATRQFPNILGNPKVHHRICKVLTIDGL
jgi:hypothetical protein